jgi:putative CocE/NonD family hydrolase
MLLLAAISAGAQAGVAAYDKEIDVPVPMRDGVHLSTNVFVPSSSGHWPVLLVRTPYNKGRDLPLSYRGFIERGYAVVVQDVRGRYRSEGRFEPLTQEGPDGEDTIRWIGQQPWCDGKIGMFGGSYVGIAQWQAALRNPPHLKAIFPVVSGYDDYFDRFYSRGGAMKLGHRLLWISENLRAPGFPKPDFNRFIYVLPLRIGDRVVTGRTIDFYQQSLNHPDYDAFWKSVSTRAKLAHLRVPVFSAGGWFDNYGQSDLEAFAMLRKMGRTAHVLIGPWGHNFSERLPVDFGPQALPAIRRYQLAWFDHWLKGQDTIANLPAVRIFTMGTNRWTDEDEWPPAETRIVAFHLDSKGKANGGKSDGVLRPHPPRRKVHDDYTYDPRKPVPTRGGPICCNARVFPPGPMDQRAVEQRPDVLVYTSAPLETDTEVTGVIRVQLWVSTSAPDSDFTAKLVDVAPDGAAISLTDGILRLRYRNGLEKAELAKPGTVYPIVIDAGVTSNVFRAGHRIRLEISSSNFPRFDRNLNTGRLAADDKEIRVARQSVLHGGPYPSALLLPIVPR